RRPAVGCELAGVDPALKLLRAPAPEERGLAAILRQASVEEDRETEIVARPLSEREGHFARGRLVLGAQRYERDDVRGADPRVRSLVPAKVDPLRSRRDPGSKRLDEVVSRSDEREDGPAVIPVAVDVEQPPRLRERMLERGDRLGVSPFRE